MHHLITIELKLNQINHKLTYVVSQYILLTCVNFLLFELRSIHAQGGTPEETA
jgi:hypothetical protein